MKPVSKNMSASLRGQRIPGRGPMDIATGEPNKRPSMTVPGEGGIEEPPGQMHERSAAHFVAPQAKGVGV